MTTSVSPPFLDNVKRIMGKPSRTDSDRAQLAALEAAVDKALPAIAAMKSAGQALGEIRAKQLYRLTHSHWETYVEERFSMSVRRADQLVDFGVVHEAVEAVAREIGTAVPILSERALRPVARLDADDRQAALVEAANSPEGMTAATIKAAASSRRKPARRGVPRPVRFRVPGGIVIVEISRKGAAAGATVEALLADALRQLQAREAA